MKKLLILASAAIFGATQQSNAQAFSIGPVAGIGHTWITNVPGNTDFKIAPALGIGMMYSRSNWGFGGDVLVSHEGYIAEYRDDQGGQYDVNINPIYIRVNPKVAYYFSNWGNWIRPNVYVGPSIGFKVDEVQDYSVNNNGNGADNLNMNSNLFDKTDVGAIGGVGVNMRVAKKTWFTLGGEYYMGFTDAQSDFYRGVNNQNRNARLKVGFMFGI